MRWTGAGGDRIRQSAAARSGEGNRCWVVEFGKDRLVTRDRPRPEHFTWIFDRPLRAQFQSRGSTDQNVEQVVGRRQILTDADPVTAMV
jgi:hypothetical protein